MKQKQIIFIKIFTVLLFLNMATYAQNRIDTLLLSMQHHLFLENISMRGSTTISNSAAVDFSTPANGGMAIGYRIVPRITKSSAIGIGISLGMINQERSEYKLSKDYFFIPNDYKGVYLESNAFYKFTLEYVFRKSISAKYLLETQIGVNMIGVPFMFNRSGSLSNLEGTVIIPRKSYTQDRNSPIGFHAGLGIARMLRNRNFLRLGFTYYHAPHTIFYAEYKFTGTQTTNPQVDGRYTQTASHLAITLGYVFSTNKRRRVVYYD